MAKIKNFIEINGKRYDAVTGVLVVAGGSPATVATTTQIHKTPKTPPRKSAVAHSAKSTPGKRHRALRPVAAHAPAPARTLMRQVVVKPSPSLKRRFKAIAAIDFPAPTPSFSLVVKSSVLSLDDKRLQHARQISKSHAISRFSQGQPIGQSIKVSVLPAPAPVPQPPTYRAAALKTKRPKTTADILELALQQATSHLQPPVEPVRHRHLWHRSHKAAAAH